MAVDEETATEKLVLRNEIKRLNMEIERLTSLLDGYRGCYAADNNLDPADFERWLLGGQRGDA